MKAVILNDTHFGFKNDSCILLDYFLEVFDEQLFPYLKEHNIKTIFHLGDVFDRRKYVNFKTLHRVRKEFLEPLQEMGIKVHALPLFQTGTCIPNQRTYISQWGVSHSYRG